MPDPGAESSGWELDIRLTPGLPPRAWVLRAQAPRAKISCGVHVERIGRGIFEGTWVGRPGPEGILESTTTFGSGVLIDGDFLYLVPPSHHLESVYVCQSDGALFASNSLVGLLTAGDVRLLPDVDYPQVFAHAGDGQFRYNVPVEGGSVDVLLYDGARLGLDGRLTDVAKPREAPFVSYAEYLGRLHEAVGSVAANAPGYELVATMSSGYDSAAMAAVARAHGLRRAVTIAEGKPVRGSNSVSDSGAPSARALGLAIQSYERLAYQHSDHLPEAEFLASGMSGEDVIFSSMGPDIARTILLTGFFGDSMWWSHRPHRPLFWRLEQAGLSFSEFRLRVGFIHVPLPWFGASQMYSVEAITHSEEMRPWVLGMDNDRPIARRILEDAGVPRGSFADAKRAASASIHADGPAAMAPTSRASLEAFARARGERVSFVRKRFPRWRRFAFSRARRWHLRRIAEWLERPRRRVVRHQPEFGNLLLRWAVSVVAPRYRDVAQRG